MRRQCVSIWQLFRARASMQPIEIVRGIGSHSANDCFVQSLANAFNLRYSEASSIADSLGRCPKSQGMSLSTATDFLLSAGMRCESFRYNGCKLAPYLRNVAESEANKSQILFTDFGSTVRGLLSRSRYRHGRFIFLVRGHVFAVVNGKIIDHYASLEPEKLGRAKVQAVFICTLAAIEKINYICTLQN